MKGDKPLFPGSRELFGLVRAMADRQERTEEMSDADIGRVIGFESARTSRWKHGRIAVDDAARLLSLSQSFDLDLTLLAHVAAGFLAAKDGLAILKDQGKLVRFWGEQLRLPENDQALTVTAGDGTKFRVIRRTSGHYERVEKKRAAKGKAVSEEQVVLLADDDPAVVELFGNLTEMGAGLRGVVARSGPQALVIAGNLRPSLIVFDLFIGGLDGLAAIRTLTTQETTRASLVVATSRVVTPDISRTAIGCGAAELLKRPLGARTLTHLLARVRRK